MKINFLKNVTKPITFIIFLISLISLKNDNLNAEYLNKELQIETMSPKDAENHGEEG